jgi:hypothetical protein
MRMNGARMNSERTVAKAWIRIARNTTGEGWWLRGERVSERVSHLEHRERQQEKGDQRPARVDQLLPALETVLEQEFGDQ